MILFPSSIFLKRLTCGSVIKFSHPDFPEKPHNFIVLNSNPLKDGFLLLIVSTSNVERVKEIVDRQRRLSGGYINVKQGEYKDFERESYINCHKPYAFEIGKLKAKYKKALVDMKERLPDELIKRVRKGCLDSPMFKPKYKKFIKIEGD
jgi:hypothetical protein